MKIEINYIQLRNWLKSTLRPAGIHVQGDSNIIGDNYSNSGIEVIGEKNVVNKNISNWLKVEGNFNKVIENKIIENIQKFSRQEIERLLDYLSEPKIHQSSIKGMLKKLFSRISIKGGISLVNIPGLPSLYIEVEKKLTQ